MNECRINPCCQDLSSFKVMDVLERACALEKEGRDIVHLQIGEPDFDTPECVKDAACKAIRDGRCQYTHSLHGKGLGLARIGGHHGWGQILNLELPDFLYDFTHC
jgi:hypothetical protein